VEKRLRASASLEQARETWVGRQPGTSFAPSGHGRKSGLVHLSRAKPDCHDGLG